MAEESLRAVEAGLRLLDLAAAQQRMRLSQQHPAAALRLAALGRASSKASTSSSSSGGGGGGGRGSSSSTDSKATTNNNIINNCGNSAATSLADSQHPALDSSSASAEWAAAQRAGETRNGAAGEPCECAALPQTTLREPAAVLGARAARQADALGELLAQRQTCISDVLRLSRAIEQQTLADRQERAAPPSRDERGPAVGPGHGSPARDRSASTDDIARAVWGVSLAEHRRNEVLPDWVRVRLDTSAGSRKLLLSSSSIL
jgi:hypothetical protein